MAESKILTVRLPSEIRDSLEAEAKEKKVKLSDLVRQKLIYSAEFEDPLPEIIEKWAKSYKVPQHIFIECVVLDFIAKRAADRNIFEPETRDSFPFIYTPGDDVVLRGVTLINHLRERYQREKKEKICERLLAKEILGEELSPDEREYLIKNHLGSTWFESEEYKEHEKQMKRFSALATEAREKKLVPQKYINLPDSLIGRMYEQILAGNSSEEDMKRIFREATWQQIYQDLVEEMLEEE